MHSETIRNDTYSPSRQKSTPDNPIFFLHFNHTVSRTEMFVHNFIIQIKLMKLHGERNFFFVAVYVLLKNKEIGVVANLLQIANKCKSVGSDAIFAQKKIDFTFKMAAQKKGERNHKQSKVPCVVQNRYISFLFTSSFPIP